VRVTVEKWRCSRDEESGSVRDVVVGGGEVMAVGVMCSSRWNRVTAIDNSAISEAELSTGDKG